MRPATARLVPLTLSKAVIAAGVVLVVAFGRRLAPRAASAEENGPGRAR